MIRDGRFDGGIGVTTFELELDPSPDAQGVGIALCTVGENWMKLTMKWTMKWTKNLLPVSSGVSELAREQMSAAERASEASRTE